MTFTVETVPVSSATTGTVSGTYRGITRTSATLTVNPPALSHIDFESHERIGRNGVNWHRKSYGCGRG